MIVIGQVALFASDLKPFASQFFDLCSPTALFTLISTKKQNPNLKWACKKGHAVKSLVSVEECQAQMMFGCGALAADWEQGEKQPHMCEFEHT